MIPCSSPCKRPTAPSFLWINVTGYRLRGRPRQYLVRKLAAGRCEKVAIATHGNIAANATPIGRMWGAVATMTDHEPEHP